MQAGGLSGRSSNARRSIDAGEQAYSRSQRAPGLRDPRMERGFSGGGDS